MVIFFIRYVVSDKCKIIDINTKLKYHSIIIRNSNEEYKKLLGSSLLKRTYPYLKWRQLKSELRSSTLILLTPQRYQDDLTIYITLNGMKCSEESSSCCTFYTNLIFCLNIKHLEEIEIHKNGC